MSGQPLPTRAESLSLTREQVADLTAQWPLAGIKMVLHPFVGEAFLEFRFTMPTEAKSELLISLDYHGGARRYDVLDDARWQLACTVFDLGYPTRGD